MCIQIITCSFEICFIFLCNYDFVCISLWISFFIFLTSCILILYFKHNNNTIPTCSNQILIISCNSHLFNASFIMSLIFYICTSWRSHKWILVTSYSTRVSIFITNTCKEDFVATWKTNLRQCSLNITLGLLLILIEFSKIAILTYCIHHFSVNCKCHTWLRNVLSIGFGMYIQHSWASCICTNLPQWDETIMSTWC